VFSLDWRLEFGKGEVVQTLTYSRPQPVMQPRFKRGLLFLGLSFLQNGCGLQGANRPVTAELA